MKIKAGCLSKKLPTKIMQKGGIAMEIERKGLKWWGWVATLVAIFVPAIPAWADNPEPVEPVEIRQLNVAPWLGPIRDGNHLANLFARGKKDFIYYIKFDLEKSAGLEITQAEAKEIADAMEVAISRTEEISLPDGTVGRSMGWRSKATGKLMRTANPVLRLGRPVKCFTASVEFKRRHNHKGKILNYMFLKDCGNLWLQGVQEIVEEAPPKAEVVPPSKREVTEIEAKPTEVEREIRIKSRVKEKEKILVESPAFERETEIIYLPSPAPAPSEIPPPTSYYQSPPDWYPPPPPPPPPVYYYGGGEYQQSQLQFRLLTSIIYLYGDKKREAPHHYYFRPRRRRHRQPAPRYCPPGGPAPRSADAAFRQGRFSGGAGAIGNRVRGFSGGAQGFHGFSRRTYGFSGGIRRFSGGIRRFSGGIRGFSGGMRGFSGGMRGRR